MSGYAELALVRGMSFLADQQSAIANNLANAATNTYKRRTSIAQQVTSEFESLLRVPLPSVAYREQIAFARGIERPTGEDMNVSIGAASSFFRVTDSDNRTYLTRVGELGVDSEGFLSTRSGNRYLDSTGEPISLAGATSIAISSNGVISGTATDEDGRTTETEFGTVAAYAVPAPERLRPVGQSLYRDDVGQEVALDAAPGIRQGFLEQSNVDSLQELVSMIVVQREFQATTRALTTIGRIQETYVSAMNR